MSKTFEEIKTYCKHIRIIESIDDGYTVVEDYCRKNDDYCASAHCPLLGIIMKGIEGGLNE